LLAATFSHRETLFRAAGALADGLHEFAVPVDPTVGSALFSVSVQCLQVVEVVRPSGALLEASDEGVEYHQFESGRVVTVRAPDPGTWRVRASGRGIFFVVVQARSEMSLAVQLLAKRGAEMVPVFQPAPPGATQLVAVALHGTGEDFTVRLVSATAETLGPVQRVPGRAGEERWTGEFTVPPMPFRIAVSTTTGDAGRADRVHAPLLGVSGR
jgi:hypothetical protein